VNSNQATHILIFLCCLYSAFAFAGLVRLAEKQQKRIDRLSKEKRIMWLIVGAFVLAGYAYFIFCKDVIK